MLQDAQLIESRHKRFIRTVCASEIVFGLENQDGFASSSSNHYEDEDENPVGIICFWAERALAQSCIEQNWSDYKTVEIPLAEFMENWCVGMANDELLVGTEFDRNLFGYEADPLELILELSAELTSLGKDLHFHKYNGLADLTRQVKAIIE